MKKTGVTGSVAVLSIETKELYTINDLAYVYAYSQKIDHLYKKLLRLYERSQRKVHVESYTQWSKRNKIDTRLMPSMKLAGYCNNSCEWTLPSLPSKSDAIFLQLKIRNRYRSDKS